MDRPSRREAVVQTTMWVLAIVLVLVVRLTNLWWFWLIVIAVVGVTALALRATGPGEYATFHVRKVARRGSVRRGYVMYVSPYGISIGTSWSRVLLTFGFANTERTKQFGGPDSVLVTCLEGNRLNFVDREKEKPCATVCVNAYDWPRVLDFLAQTGYAVTQVGGHEPG